MRAWKFFLGVAVLFALAVKCHGQQIGVDYFTSSVDSSLTSVATHLHADNGVVTGSTIGYTPEDRTAYVLTCAHLWDKKSSTAPRVEWFSATGTDKHSGELIAKNHDVDLALVKVVGVDEKPCVTIWRQCESLKPGISVWSVGSDLGAKPSLRYGTFRKWEFSDNMIQATPSVIAGRSGGGLFAKEGGDTEVSLIGALSGYGPASGRYASVKHIHSFLLASAPDGLLQRIFGGRDKICQDGICENKKEEKKKDTAPAPKPPQTTPKPDVKPETGPQGERGPAGKDGVDGKPGATGAAGPKPTDDDLIALIRKVFDERAATLKGEKGDRGDKGEKGDKGDVSTIPPIEGENHIVIVADTKSDYWPRLSGDVERAKGYYSAIKVAPPPTFSVPLPQLVVYENAIPVRRVAGLYAVNSELQRIVRGEFVPKK